MSVAALTAAGYFANGTGDRAGPRLWPYFVFLGVALLGAALYLGAHYFRHSREEEAVAVGPPRIRNRATGKMRLHGSVFADRGTEDVDNAGDFKEFETRHD